MQLSILILNYKTKEKTVQCIKSILNFVKVKFAKGSYEIILVDNGSGDGSIEFFTKEFHSYSYIHTVESKTNLGFGPGLNLASKYAKGKYLLFLNSDTEFTDSNIEKTLSYFGEHTNIGIVGGRLIDSKGHVQRSAARFPLFLQVLLFLGGMERFARIRNDTKITDVDWVEGSFMLVRKDVFEKIGKFDEHMFMYVEDVELCLRARKLHYLVKYVPFSTIKHIGQGSSNRSFAIVHIYEGILYLYKKHRSNFEYTLVKLLLQSKALILVLLGKLTKNNYLTSTYEKALSTLR